MLILDQINKSDRSLRFIALGVLAGIIVLVTGLWWVQIVSSKHYSKSQEKQMVRRVRVPALRGKILDRNGNVLAENKPQYNVNVYFDELRDQYWFNYTNSVRCEYLAQHPKLKTPPVAERPALYHEAWYRTVSNVTLYVSMKLGEPRLLSRPAFLKHYTNYPYVPFVIFQNLTPKQVAMFSEQLSSLHGLELEAKSVRTYPNGSTAAHLLGYVSEERQIDENDENNFNYYVPDYVGRMGTEGAFDAYLRGKAGVKTVVVNSTQYRQREEMSQTEPGQNVWLTIDVELQKQVEKYLTEAPLSPRPTRGAAIVMDINTGDILAMASTPTFDPNIFLRGITTAEAAYLNDTFFTPSLNRATFGAFTPGSIFKIITGIACLESGLDPTKKIHTDGEWKPPGGGRSIDDTAPAGEYDFERAFKRSSNSYFIIEALHYGLPKIVEVGRRFHLGERTQIPTRQEVSGTFPQPGKLQNWIPRTPNVSIGQEITVTPLQMACMTAAVANGGKLFWPRIVTHTEAAAGTSAKAIAYPQAQVREHIQLHPQHLALIHRAMLADVEDAEGTGTPAYVDGTFRIGGKTGTAEIKRKNGEKDKNTWFVSFGPIDAPRYAVVVLVESGNSGGKSCAPVARRIYQALQKRDLSGSKLASLTR